MKDLTVFDVETPNPRNDRICSIAVCFVRSGEVIEGYSFLIDPETDFEEICTSIHGITAHAVINAPIFSQVWGELEPWFTSYPVVAHNAPFDLSVLRKTLQGYGLPVPDFQYIDTYKIARSLNLPVTDYKLNTLCDYFDIELCHHHDAMCDARACADLLVAMDHLSPVREIAAYAPSCKRESYSSHKGPARYTSETQSLQLLQGILMGITSDGVVNEAEFVSLSAWLDENRHLAGNYPFDRVYAAISHVSEDGIVERSELEALVPLFQSFLNPVDSAPPPSLSVQDFVVSGKSIVLTGDFSFAPRKQLECQLTSLGAACKGAVSRKTDYVVVGELGSPSWKFGTYGSKVQDAQKLIDAGAKIVILKEKEFISFLEASELCLK